ncbi:MAG TPA: hypothetical protein VI796_01760 [Candidatus Thermoplasmatota archaeon]|nr:hypothetical protein [Candidatus Thermoplasmatota archaeon]
MEGETAPGVPTWVKVLGGALLVALVALLALHFAGIAPARH